MEGGDGREIVTFYSLAVLEMENGLAGLGREFLTHATQKETQ
jgi:hypothetical protein